MIKYQINKGVNRPIEFRGLKGQYIYFLGGGLAALLVLFSILYIVAVPAFLLVPVIGIAGVGLFSVVFRLSHRYGAHGLMKAIARRQVPAAVYIRSRKVITEMNTEIKRKEKE